MESDTVNILPPGSYDFTVDDAYLINTVAEIIDKLAKPTMVFRLAKGNIKALGAQKRLLNAAKEIDLILGLRD